MKKQRKKLKRGNVQFIKADICEKWKFAKNHFDLVTCSLILEHIDNIGFVFQQVNKVLKRDGLFYLGELHPFKQYQGSSARFETKKRTVELNCFIHHFSDYFKAAEKNHFLCLETEEWFDDDRCMIPRLLTMIFKKK